MIVGITGGTGSGKTTLLEEVRNLGGLVLDCDKIYHELLQTDPVLLTAIETRFPGTVEGNVLNRKKLGSMVFSDTQALLDLNRITHGAVKAEVLRRLEKAPKLVAIDAIELFAGGLDELCSLTVAVTAPEEVRVQRLMIRDGISESYARARIAAQKKPEYFAELCDYVLENSGTVSDFRAKCLAFFRETGIMRPEGADNTCEHT